MPARCPAYLVELVRENEALVRGALLLSLQQWAKLQAGEDLGEQPIQRGGRRGLIQATLEPYAGNLGDATLRRLAIGLSLVVGIEARIVLRDIWHLDEDEIEEIVRWAARSLAQAAATQRHNA
jgi:hypothetical protein